MELFIRPMTLEERKYTYSQSSQLMGQTGSIGRLRGDFDSDGNGFFTSWDDHVASYKTDEFKAELDEVINHLRSDSGMLLKCRSAMAAFCREYPESAFDGNYCKEYGFRADTEGFAYLIRCNPNKGDYNFYVFTYVSQWLDKHIQNAGRGIRFIDSRYNELFRIKDGDSMTREKLTVCR